MRRNLSISAISPVSARCILSPTVGPYISQYSRLDNVTAISFTLLYLCVHLLHSCLPHFRVMDTTHGHTHESVEILIPLVRYQRYLPVLTGFETYGIACRYIKMISEGFLSVESQCDVRFKKLNSSVSRPVWNGLRCCSPPVL